VIRFARTLEARDASITNRYGADRSSDAANHNGLRSKPSVPTGADQTQPPDTTSHPAR
jgi:hypothetical protein